MSLTFFIGVLTLAPAALAVLVLVAGVARLPRLLLVVALAVVGALIPAICLPFFIQPLTSGDLVRLPPLFGDPHIDVASAWFSPAYRVDAFSVFAAYGIVFLITPLLLWMAFHGETPAAVTQPADAADAEGADGADAAPEDEDVEEFEDGPPAPAGGLFQRHLASAQWGGVALALLVESAALTVVFADNVIWLGLAWIVLAACAWGLGEMGSDLQTLDRTGLVFILAGPLLWLLTLLLPAITRQTPRSIFPTFSDMMGRGGTAPVFVILVAIALGLAGGAYPFTVWVRRRAALITPAGLAVIALLLLPITLFVSARTFGALQDATNLLPQIGTARPPITAGIGFALLGAFTVGVSGLLALERRDSRSLIAFLAVAQVGWGMLAVGTSTAVSALGLTLLLATSVLGLGAMLAALYASGALLSDIEPETTGPRPLGVPLRPLHLAGWTIGAVTLVGAPLFAGFLSRQLISAGAVQSRGLAVPLLALAWIGDGLLLLALIRATAPAFASIAVSRRTSEGEQVTSSAANWSLDIPTLAVALLALLALVPAVAPQVLLTLGGTLAAGALVQGGVPALQTQTLPLGYSADGVQWLPTLGWIALVVLGALLAFLLQGRARERRPLVLAGQRATDLAAVASDADTERAQAAALADPGPAWVAFSAAFISFWTMPGGSRLLRDVESAPEASEEPSADELDVEELDVDEGDLEADEIDADKLDEDDIELVESDEAAAVGEIAAAEAHAADEQDVEEVEEVQEVEVVEEVEPGADALEEHEVEPAKATEDLEAGEEEPGRVVEEPAAAEGEPTDALAQEEPPAVAPEPAEAQPAAAAEPPHTTESAAKTAPTEAAPTNGAKSTYAARPRGSQRGTGGKRGGRKGGRP